MSKVKASTYLKTAEKCRKLMLEALIDREKLKKLDEEYGISRITLKDGRDVEFVPETELDYESDLNEDDEIKSLTIETFGYGTWVTLDYPTVDDKGEFEFSLYDEDVQFEIATFSLGEIAQLARRDKVIVIKGDEIEILPKTA